MRIRFPDQPRMSFMDFPSMVVMSAYGMEDILQACLSYPPQAPW